LRVSVLGAGCIGGSLALKLRRDFEVRVFDVDEDVRSSLKSEGIVVVDRPEDLYDSDLLVLAVPMSEEERFLKETSFSGLMMDVASVKTPFVRIARERGLKLVGGHPMAGNEKKGKAGWDPNMFEGRPFFLCGLDGRRVEIAEEVVRKTGAVPVWLDPEEHDEIVAAVSHVQYLLSLAGKFVGKAYEDFAGPGYKSTTRLAHQNVQMALDMMRYNRDNVLKNLKAVLSFLKEVEGTIDGGDMERLEKLIREVIT